MAKGDKKRKLSLFQKGNKEQLKRKIEDKGNEPSNKIICKRLDRNTFNDIVIEKNGIKAFIDPEGNETFAKVLRPKDEQYSFEERFARDGDNAISKYRLLEMNKTAELFETAYKEHSVLHSSCQGKITWNWENERQWGLCWSEGLHCTLCSYQTQRMKLYDEINNTGKGRKAAKPNVGIQVGLAGSSISNSSFCDILLHGNIPCPSDRVMQRTANRVCEQMKVLNEKDMESIRGQLKELNKIKGIPETTPIKIEGDCRYSNRLNSGGGKTPFQPATQATYTLCENETKSKRIISVTNYSKLCPYRKNGELDCGNHRGCVQNVKAKESIGDERRYAKEAYEKCVKDDLLCKYLTTDSDSKAFEGVNSVEKSVSKKNLTCIKHLCRTQQRMIERKNFSYKMFSCKTKSEYDKIKKRFARDVSLRCAAEFTAALKRHGNDTNGLIRSLSFVCDSIILCYNGCCALCKVYSFICRGNCKKSFLPEGHTRVFMNLDDQRKLRPCLALRFSRKAIEATQFGTQTQKCEAVNKAYIKAVPKSITFSRNYAGRIHTAVHTLNNGFAKSTIKKCAFVKAGLSSGSVVAKKLLLREKKKKYLSTYMASTVAKNKRVFRRNAWYSEYDKKTNKIQCYDKRKGESKICKRFGDHIYSK